MNNKRQNAKRLAWSLTSDDAIMAFMENHPNGSKALARLAEALELPERPMVRPKFPPLKIAR
jgi:hypothetical protein